MNRRRALRVLGGAAVVGLAGCLRGDDGPAPVALVDLRFDPERLSVRVGRTVEWTNESDVAHTVTAYEGRLPAGATYFASGGFESEAAARQHLDAGLLAPGDTYTHTFGTAGVHPYYCIPHEGSGMTGIVTVG